MIIYVLNFATHTFYTTHRASEAIRKVNSLMEQYALTADDFEIIAFDDASWRETRFDFEDFCEKWG